jgi:hypothetical protein
MLALSMEILLAEKYEISFDNFRSLEIEIDNRAHVKFYTLLFHLQSYSCSFKETDVREQLLDSIVYLAITMIKLASCQSFATNC